MVRDPYKALGVDSKASNAEIKKAYRRLAKQFHPDCTGGDKVKESRFKDISTAYNILSDPEKRAQFDNMSSGGNIPMGDLSEIFAQMFGQAAAPRSGRARAFGGMGGSPFGGMGGSPFGGMGGNPFGGMGGNPSAPRTKAPRTAPPRDRKVKASDGSPLILRGVNIHSDLRIPFDLAMRGTVAKVATLEGVAKMRVPPGTCSGQKLRLKGKGHRSGHGVSGDHFVTVHIDVPKVSDGRAGELLAKLVEFLAKDKS